MKGTVAVLGLACALASAAAAESQWDLPTNYAASAFHTKNIAQFAADVDKATSGSLKIAVHPGGTMIKHAEIKRAVVGYGRAEKHQVQQMIKLLLGLAKAPTPHDAADALAVAICHVHSRPAARLHVSPAAAANARGAGRSWRQYRPPAHG